jgi:hypothetical protein
MRIYEVVNVAESSIQFRRPEADSATLLKSGVEAIGIVVAELAVFLGPISEELLQSAHSVCAIHVELVFRTLPKRFDAHGLSFGQGSLGIENNDTVLHVSDKRR